MLEIVVDPDEDAAWRLTLSSQGGATLHQGSSSRPSREFTSMTGSEVTWLSLAAVEQLSVDCVRALCRFGAWETVETCLTCSRPRRRGWLRSKLQPRAWMRALYCQKGGGCRCGCPLQMSCTSFCLSCCVVSPHSIVKLAEHAQIAAPHLDFGLTGEGAPTLLYLQQLKLPCLSRCGGLQTLHDMRGVVYLSVYVTTRPRHVATRFGRRIRPRSAQQSENQAATDQQQPQHRFLGDG